MEGEEEAKQWNPRSLIPFTELNQVSSDFILAMTMQEQEQAYTMLETIESDSEEEEGKNSGDEEDEYEAPQQGQMVKGETREGKRERRVETMGRRVEEGKNSPSRGVLIRSFINFSIGRERLVSLFV